MEARRVAGPAGPPGPSHRGDFLLGAAVFLAGVAMATFLHWQAFGNDGIYKEDIVQSPHWAAYHTSSFQPDDLLVRYATFNESPLQNTLYWTGTWIVDYIPLTKFLGVASYGLLSLIFFLVGRAMFGVRFGLLLALFITFFPDHWEFSAGFFSKFWMTPLLLVCVFVLQTGRWKWLIGLLPFAAIAYPMSAVLIGMTVSVYWVQEYLGGRGGSKQLFRYLAIGSLLAGALLMLKYVAPPDFIGPMRPGEELRDMPELRKGGFPSPYVPVPSLESKLIEHVEHPFVLLSAIFYFMVLGRGGVGWERSWTALFFASAIGYLLADYFFMRLYLPNRYSRHSMAVLLALWNARNWDLVLSRLNGNLLRYASVASLLIVGGFSYSTTFEPGRGFTDWREVSPVSRFVREELPEGILLAGSPRPLDSIMIQARRSVLAPYKLAHPWFTTYDDEIRERTRATLRAHFADGPGPINELHRRWGATHFIVQKGLFERLKEKRPVYAEPYNKEIYDELGPRGVFYLRPPPRRLVIWEDEHFAVIELPIPVAPVVPD